jgi:hypothetical protein
MIESIEILKGKATHWLNVLKHEESLLNQTQE